MFDRDRIEFNGNHIQQSYGPFCEASGFVITPEICAACPNCYRIKTRYWDEYDSNGEPWKYGAYNGHVWCGQYDSYFLRKIKKHIFKLKYPKEEVKELSK